MRNTSAAATVLAAVSWVVFPGCASNQPTPLTRSNAAADTSVPRSSGARSEMAQHVPIESNDSGAMRTSDSHIAVIPQISPPAEDAPRWTGRQSAARADTPVRSDDVAGSELSDANDVLVSGSGAERETAIGAADWSVLVQAAERVPTVPRVPIDTGALRLLELMRDALERESSHPVGDAPVICIGALTNRSRATDREAQDMQERFSALLQRAAEARGSQVISFSDDPQLADARMTGRAYLLVADGSDQWELWITLRGDNGEPPIWSNDEPIRLLRQPRASGPQITRWPGSVPAPVRLPGGP